MASIIDIAQNNTTAASTNTISVSTSVSGTNTLLIFTVIIDRLSGSSGLTATATCNGIAMTSLASQTSAVGGQQALFSFYVVSPASGNCVATISSSCNYLAAFVNVFGNVHQSLPIDGSATISTIMPNSSSYLLTQNLTVTNTDDWLFSVGAIGNQYGSISSTWSPGWGLLGSNSPGAFTFQAGSASNFTNQLSGVVTTSMLFNNGGYPSAYGFEMIFMGVALRRTANSFSYTPLDGVINGKYRETLLSAGTTPLYPPVITIRQKTSPFAIISTVLNYLKTSLLGTILPVLNNENSDTISLRIYNDFEGLKNIADAINVTVTTWDGNTLTASMAVASQQWLHVQQTGFGEGSSGGALYTSFPGIDYSVGGSNNAISLDYASNGTPSISEIRSSSSFSGAGFVEMKTYIQPKLGAPGELNNFVIAVSYQYSL